MKTKIEIIADQYSDIDYKAFNLSSKTKMFLRICGWITLPVVYPLVWISRISPETGFVTISEALAIIPLAFGLVVRYEFYKRALRSCGKEVLINFGTTFKYPDISIGDYVSIGPFNTIHHCDFGDFIMSSPNCHFLSGSKQHNYDRLDIPMAIQGGKMIRIKIDNDVWVGANTTIMNSIGKGSIIGAGTVVNKKIAPFSIVVGNPARVIKKRIMEYDA